MSGRRFMLVDVFAERRHAGNQLAVVIDGEGLSAAEMQQIALEMNFSETSFLLSPVERDGGFDVRIFTPREEVPFAGHPTLGTAWVVRERLGGGRLPRIVLHLPVGPIPVTFSDEEPGGEVLWMRQNPPQFGPRMEPAAAARLLRLDPGAVDARFPAQQVSTGLPFLLVPLEGLEAVRRARLDPAAYDELVASDLPSSVLLFCGQARDPANHLHARMFADSFGVPEDPATGSANGCLAAWLVEHGYFGDGAVDVRVEQGEEMGRPSLLRLRAARDDGGVIRVDVGGRVVPVARGELL